MLSRASKMPFALQAALVFILVGSSTYAAGYFDFRNGSNVVWMLGIPIATAIIANNDSGSRTLAGIALIITSYVAVCLWGQAYGFY